MPPFWQGDDMHGVREIILKKVDVKCHIIKVILFCVKVLVAEKNEKVTFD